MGTKIVAVTINRGGQGKTMLCRSLGTLAGEVGLTSLVIDMDTQQNSTNWRKRRPKERLLPLVEFSTENDLEEVIERARKAECDLVMIDTPPGRSTEAAAAVEAADLVLVPVNDERETWEGVPRTARLARSAGKPAFVVPNRVHPQSLKGDREIRAVAEAAGLDSTPATLHQFTVHKDASHEGLTATEKEPKGTAATELRDLWIWLRGALENLDKTNAHKVA
jgi:chromosome partitioning protein